MPNGLYQLAEHAEPRSVTRAQVAARKVEIHVASGNFPAAHAAIAEAQREAIEDRPRGDVRRLNLSEVGLDYRDVNALEYAGIVTVGQLADIARDRPEKLLAIPHIGTKTLAKFALLLEALGCYVRPAELVAD